MEKKEYIKPEMELTLLEGEVLMQSASNFDPESGDGYEGDDAGIRGRRGNWGDLWGKGE